MLYDPKWSEAAQITKLQEVLLLAAEKLEKFGHIKNDMGDETRGFCVSGAIRAASAEMTGTELPRSVYTRPNEDFYQLHLIGLDAVAKALGSEEKMDAVDWNNAKERTKDEVIDLLRKVATHAV